ncbi:MAG: DUF6017 domain-containing protein [Acutalibacteraceae bacterium]
MKNNYSEVCKKNQSRSHCRVSFSESLRRVRGRIEISSFEPSDRALANELILIIAEVGALPLGSQVQVNGEKLSAETVSEVYAQLEKEHLELVIEKFRAVKYEIKYRKSYFRTALYNCVFEFESYYENQVRKDGTA